MSPIRFLLYQCFLFTALILLNFYTNPYISKPFTRVDAIALAITTPILFLLLGLQNFLYTRFHSKLRKKIILSIAAFVFVVIIMVLLENIWFEIKGDMLFK
ncbi:hypothetical protein [Bacillus sp. FJAT-45037]|uniref:hypothetical protein n=1 Tax=Bacillus sp. FJAT-45037 TaxID=2011007 RepID=UPI000C2426A6|nr:hypothetical protein [Bacillus sp. FJAT-45037]